MVDDHENLISKHSSGVSIIIRIDGLWRDANLCSCTGLFDKWNRKLDVIWRELARDIKDDDWKTKKKEFDVFDADLVKQGPFQDMGSESFDKPEEGASTKRSKQYKILNDKELFLKRLENHLGKGTTWDNEDDDDF